MTQPLDPVPMPPPPRSVQARRRWLRWVGFAVALVVAFVAGMVAAQDGIPEETAADTTESVTDEPLDASAAAPSTTRATPSPIRTPRPTPTVYVTLTCYLDESFAGATTFRVGAELAWAPIWEQEPYSCDATRNGTPLTAVEQEAFDVSGYDESASIETLYGICAEVDPTDPYTSGEHTASESQIPEIRAVLALCPSHPLAAEFSATAARGEADAALVAEGRLVRGGTHLVGSEIQPGTYYAEEPGGSFDACYWERTDSAGEIIDNNFTTGARRVDVTIEENDYSFNSDGCGAWRPVP